MVRIHYELPDELHRRVKSAAALKGMTLKAYIEAALEQAAARDEKRKR